MCFSLSGASKTVIRNMDTSAPLQPDSLSFWLLKEHRVSSVNVQDGDGRFQDAHHLCLPVTAKD